MKNRLSNSSKLAVISMLVTGISNYNNESNSPQKIDSISYETYRKAENFTPKLLSIQRKSLVEEAQGLFKGIRGFTEEEGKAYEESLLKLFKPTGKSFFDL